IGREYGSRGHIIANRIAEKLSIPVYDKNILQEIAQKHNSDYEELKKFDEKPRNVWFSRRLGEFSSSMEQEMANMQFTFLKEKASSGESFVVIGRCADVVLADEEGLVTIFICADVAERIKRVSETDNVSENEAKLLIARKDKKRKDYHDEYAESEWGTAAAYDLCLNVSGMEVDEAADFIISFVNRKNI
ncbi:MAG: AAA family ATPase, partial [Coprococcus sp.]